MGLGISNILTIKYKFLGHLIGNYFIRLENRLLSESDKIIVISEDFQTHFLSCGFSQNKIELIPNLGPN